MASYLSSVYSVTICSSLKYGDPENYWDFEQSYKLSAFKAVSIMNSVVRIHAYKNLHFLPFFFFFLQLNTSGPNFRIHKTTKSFMTKKKIRKHVAWLRMSHTEKYNGTE